MKALLLVLAPPVVGFAALLPRHAPASPAEDGVVLEERRIDFREDAEPGRIVGEVRAALRVGERVRLEVVASATGPRVMPAPGPEGVHGGNRIAGEELDALLRRGGLSLRVEAPHGASPTAGVPPATRRGPLLVRAMDAQGRVTHVPAGGGDLALEARLETPSLEDGISRVDVVADGRVRVRAVVRVTGREGRVLALEQVAESHP